MTEPINPDHYKRLPAEAIEIIESAIENAPDNIAAYNHGQQLKYDLRLFRKGKTLRDYLIDQEKHCWYADRLRDHLRKLVEQEDEREKQKAADLQSLKEHPFGKPKTAPLNSDTIPEGYRKLNDSSEEPRQMGDLRWSVSEKRYIPITRDEIFYANRDNWAACRKTSQEVTPEVTQEVKPPDGWRFLERGELIRNGDKYFDMKSQAWIKCIAGVGDYLQGFHKPTIRRKQFNVGEKVVDFCGQFWEVEFVFDTDNRYRLKNKDVRDERYGNSLAPCIEDAK